MIRRCPVKFPQDRSIPSFWFVPLDPRPHPPTHLGSRSSIPPLMSTTHLRTLAHQKENFSVSDKPWRPVIEVHTYVSWTSPLLRHLEPFLFCSSSSFDQARGQLKINGYLLQDRLVQSTRLKDAVPQSRFDGFGCLPYFWFGQDSRRCDLVSAWRPWVEIGIQFLSRPTI